MNDIENWVKQWPNVIVGPIKLGPADADTHIKRDRRKRFYEQFGNTFDYSSEEKQNGRSKEIKVANLNTITK